MKFSKTQKAILISFTFATVGWIFAVLTNLIPPGIFPIYFGIISVLSFFGFIITGVHLIDISRPDVLSIRCTTLTSVVSIFNLPISTYFNLPMLFACAIFVGTLSTILSGFMLGDYYSMWLNKTDKWSDDD